MLRKADKRLFRHRTNVLAACAGALVLAALPALAALSSTPDATWGVLGPPGTDGVPKHPRVYSTLRVGETVFVGGDFAQAVPPQRSGGSAVPRADLAAIDAVTGDLDPTWDPAVSGVVHTLALSSDGSRIFAGGNFTATDAAGGSHKNLIAVDVSSGEIDPSWNVNPNFAVWSAVTSGTRLFLGGAFSNLSGNGTTVWRQRLAAVDQANGVVDRNWKPAANNTVKTLDLSSDGSWIYAGGNFTKVNELERVYLAALETASGRLVESFAPKFGDKGFWDGFGSCGNGCVMDIEASPTSVYAAAGGGRGNKVLAIDAVTSILKWERYGNGDVQALALRDGDLYVGGHFERFAGRSDRARFATLNTTMNGAVKDYYVSVDSSMGIWSLAADTSRLYVGGDFKRVGSTAQPGFAQFSDIPTPAP